MFFGRLDILRRIDEELSDGSGPSQLVALWGQGRIGKTSILYQIERRSLETLCLCLGDIQKVHPREPRVLLLAEPSERTSGSRGGFFGTKLRRGLSGVYSWMLEYLQRMAAEKKVELALGWARCFEEYVLQRFRHPNE